MRPRTTLNVLRVARELMRLGVEVVEILSILPRKENLRLPHWMFHQRAMEFEGLQITQKCKRKNMAFDTIYANGKKVLG